MRSLNDTIKKQIKKEVTKEKPIISNKIVLFKAVKPAQNFILTGLI